MAWTIDDIGDLSGRIAVVTGVTGGLGFHTALPLARHGARVLVTARDAAKGADYAARLRREAPGAQIEVVDLDLADLGAVERAAGTVRDLTDRIDVLVNNAGIMASPHARTVDGFELQIGTNHLGHFAWTAALWPVLAAGAARIVTVSSLMHSRARGLDLRSLTPEGAPRRYRRFTSYAESKLANLLFAYELDRRAKAAGLGVVSVAAHPGYASTNLGSTGPRTNGGGRLTGLALAQASRIFGQSAESGALPLLRAATDPAVGGGEYLGPDALGGLRGRPVPVRSTRVARDPDLAARLWEASERAAGLSFEVR